jgi:hypothetical protein
LNKLFSLLFLLSLGMVSCATVQPAGDAAQAAALAEREGITGTLEKPATLNPFKRYEMVLAGGEIRYFQMSIPQGWYWKLFVTAVNRSQDTQGQLDAGIIPSVPAWETVSLCDTQKEFNLKGEGDQDVLGAANSGPTRMALVELRQKGASIRVTLQSEISPVNGELMKPFGFNPAHAWPSAKED